MAKYMVLHTYTKGPEEFAAAFGPKETQEFARAMAAGETPAKCLKTWNPGPYGRTDYAFCLWEAEKPEDIETSLGAMLEYVTADIMQVDETDWAEVAKAGG